MVSSRVRNAFLAALVCGCSSAPQTDEAHVEPDWWTRTVGQEVVHSVDFGGQEIHLIRATLPPGDADGKGVIHETPLDCFGVQTAAGRELVPPRNRSYLLLEDQILLWASAPHEPGSGPDERVIAPSDSEQPEPRTVSGWSEDEYLELVGLQPGGAPTPRFERVFIQDRLPWDWADGTRPIRLSIYSEEGRLERRYEPLRYVARHDWGASLRLRSQKGTADLIVRLDPQGEEIGVYAEPRTITVTPRPNSRTRLSQRIFVCRRLDEPDLWMPHPDMLPTGALGVIPPPLPEIVVGMGERITVGAGGYHYRQSQPGRLHDWLVAFPAEDGTRRYAIADFDLSEVGAPMYSDWRVVRSEEFPRLLGRSLALKPDQIKPPHAWLALRRASDGHWILRSPYVNAASGERLHSDPFGGPKLATVVAQAEARLKALNDAEALAFDRLKAERQADREAFVAQTRAELVAARAAGDHREAFRLAVAINESHMPELEADALTTEELERVAANFYRPDAERELARSLLPPPLPSPPPPPIPMVDCGRCGGRGILTTTEALTTRFAPRITYRNGLEITTRRSITTTSERYVGVFPVCEGRKSVPSP